jgi:hypothetical protein
LEHAKNVDMNHRERRGRKQVCSLYCVFCSAFSQERKTI